jgi:hypothetical protein
MTVEAYPLTWPPGWKRTTSRTRAKFVGKAGRHIPGENGAIGRWEAKRELTISQATQRVMDELKRFGVSDWNIIISSNLQLRQDGLPRSGQANPTDPGVAVYWTKGKEGQRCMAIDRYDRVADNLAAIAATLDAMRAIERHGGATILDRAFSGFAALPSPEQPFQVLGVGANASREEVERAYRLLASKHHPDRGGDEQQMARINTARDQLLGFNS